MGASDELKNERAQNRIRERAWRLGARAYLPELTLTASENDSVSLLSSDSFQKSYSLRLEQPIFDGGKLFQSRRISRMQIAAQDKAIGRMEREIADSAISAYRNMLLAHSVLSIQEKSLESLCEQRNILAMEVELGAALPTDLAEADIKIASSRMDILSLKIDLARTEQEFAELLGLEELPALAESIDIHRQSVLPDKRLVTGLAQENNPDLESMKFSIIKKQEELTMAKRLWIPTIKLSGSFSLSGRRYPLTRHNWSVGLTIDFSSPFVSDTVQGSYGGEYPHSRTAGVSNSLSLLPNPAAAMDVVSTEASLALEKTLYERALERTGRDAARAVDRYALMEEKRQLAVEALDLSRQKLALTELRFSMGQLTRVDIMDAQLRCTEQEVAAFKAAAALLEAERALEKSLDLRSGDLARFNTAHPDAACQDADRQRRRK